MRTLIYLFMAIALWYGFAMSLNQTVKLRTTGKAVDAIITGLEKRHDCRQCNTKPIVRYTTTTGQTLEQVISRKRYTTPWDKGSTIPVLYNPEEPSSVKSAAWSDLWSAVIVFGAAAAGFTLLWIRRLLAPASARNQKLKNLTLLLLVPAYYCFMFSALSAIWRG